jgi:hypothetical protein
MESEEINPKQSCEPNSFLPSRKVPKIYKLQMMDSATLKIGDHQDFDLPILDRLLGD